MPLAPPESSSSLWVPTGLPTYQLLVLPWPQSQLHWNPTHWTLTPPASSWHLHMSSYSQPGTASPAYQHHPQQSAPQGLRRWTLTAHIRGTPRGYSSMIRENCGLGPQDISCFSKIRKRNWSTRYKELKQKIRNMRWQSSMFPNQKNKQNPRGRTKPNEISDLPDSSRHWPSRCP